MKKVSQIILKQFFDYNEDGSLIWKIRKSPTAGPGDRAGCYDGNTGYWRVGLFGKCFRLHRVIYAWHYGRWPIVIDHINGVTTDNRIENLRASNFKRNANNRRKRITENA